MTFAPGVAAQLETNVRVRIRSDDLATNDHVVLQRAVADCVKAGAATRLANASAAMRVFMMLLHRNHGPNHGPSHGRRPRVADRRGGRWAVDPPFASGTMPAPARQVL